MLLIALILNAAAAPPLGWEGTIAAIVGSGVVSAALTSLTQFLLSRSKQTAPDGRDGQAQVYEQMRGIIAELKERIESLEELATATSQKHIECEQRCAGLEGRVAFFEQDRRRQNGEITRLNAEVSRLKAIEAQKE
jgi:hypothetical protein